MTTSGVVTEAIVMGLLPFTSYDCSVTANTSVGEGPPSIILTQRTVESGVCVLHIWLMYMYNISVVYTPFATQFYVHVHVHICMCCSLFSNKIYIKLCVTYIIDTAHRVALVDSTQSE